MVSRKIQTRIEKDELGEVTVPLESFWGAGTARCLEYFPSARRRVHPDLIEALASVKKAAAIANGQLGLIDEAISALVGRICDDLKDDRWREQIVVDAIHGGSGVGLIVNINEFIYFRAREIIQADAQSRSEFSPAHLNISQSINDVFITAMRVAILKRFARLEPVLLELERLLRRKSLEFDRVIKAGRSALRDSVPVTLGQEFNCYGSVIEKSSHRLKQSVSSLEEINLGGGEVGTGYNIDPGFSALVTEILSRTTGLHLRSSDDYLRTTQSMGDFVAFSSSLKELAVELSKISNDLRNLSGGPASGKREINFPQLISQPSHLLPGLLPNVDIPPLTEQLSMICLMVMGNDQTVSLAGQAGLFEANTATPLIIDTILGSMDALESGIKTFNRYCLSKLSANAERCKETHDDSGALLVLLATEFGLEKAQEIVERARQASMDVKGFLLDSKLIPRATVDKIFHHRFLTTPKRIEPASQAPDTRNDTN
ncbi:MAG: aspartate ammonia-lyase [Cyanobacteria bacterium]|nr:aspartate ammonia-lyase [Cyanobacteriota bacterium]